MEVIPKADDAPNFAGLVGKIRAGDREAESELVDRYRRGVLVILTRIVGQRPAVEDLSQDTFQLTLEKIRRGDLREPDKLSGFVCNIARNLAIDYFRRASRHEKMKSELHKDSLSPPDPLDQVLTAEKAVIVRRILNELRPARDQEVLFRFYIAEQDKQKICAELGLTSLHFNRVLFRARERYKELYEKLVQKKPPPLG
jgi:RNA polymerase sigma-70 factor (ECF subfamily)